MRHGLIDQSALSVEVQQDRAELLADPVRAFAVSFFFTASSFTAAK
jgi:hypothetical protein